MNTISATPFVVAIYETQTIGHTYRSYRVIPAAAAQGEYQQHQCEFLPGEFATREAAVEAGNAYLVASARLTFCRFVRSVVKSGDRAMLDVVREKWGTDAEAVIVALCRPQTPETTDTAPEASPGDASSL